MEFARLELLKLSAENPCLLTCVAASYADHAPIEQAQLPVT